MSVLSQRLKQEREKAGLTQKQVAEQINVTRAAYTQYETDKCSPSLDILVKLADLYKCSIDFLVGRYN